MRNDHDANCTYEGDNNVLVQQTSNWLLGLWSRRHHDPNIFDTPMESVSFIKHHKTILASSWTATNVQDIVQLPGSTVRLILFHRI